MTQVLIGVVAGLLVGGLAVAIVMWLVLKPRTDAEYEKLRKDTEDSRNAAEREAQTIITSAQQESKAVRLEAERVTKQRYADLARAEERIDKRQSSLDQQVQRIETREQTLNKRQSRLDRLKNQLDQVEQERVEELQRVASMTTEEAKQHLLQAVETDARQDMARIIREIEDEAKETAEDKARELVSLAIQRVASDHVSDVTVSVVPLPSDDMKGRIIGRNGRNIRAFEMAAGVDVVVDDTPEAVTISSFDPVRREVARVAMARLVIDGRIHPARIEKVLGDSQSEVERDIKEAGEQAAYEANVHGLHPEVHQNARPA